LNSNSPPKQAQIQKVLILSLVGLFVSMTDVHAQAVGVDWKLYGFATIKTSGPSECFFDSKGATNGPDHHVRVWTKCLSQKDIDDLDSQKESVDKVMKNTAEKMERGYVPPLAQVRHINVNEMMVIIALEETANISSIQPQSRIFYELDCGGQMLRELSIDIQVQGKSARINLPREWQYAAPETNGAALLKILCQKP
jgi:hypothetical protein